MGVFGRFLASGKEIDDIVSMDEYKLMLWAMLGIPAMGLYATYCRSLDAFVFNLFAVLLLMASYFLGAILMHEEAMKYPMGRKHGKIPQKKKR